MNITVLLRRPAVSTATGKARSTIYLDIARGQFTKPVSIGGGRVAWPDTEVQAINEARIAGKSEAEIAQLVIELEAARNFEGNQS
jgi:prophage regulatory protein